VAFWRRLRRIKPKLTEITSVGAMEVVTTPTTRAIERIKNFFEKKLSRNQLYIALVDLDPELQSAISTASMIIERTMKGFSLRAGEKLEAEEQELLEELKILDKTLRSYIYDIAYKLIRDGDAVYVVGVSRGRGIEYLKWIPIDQLTILESKQQYQRFTETVQEANWYCVNEVPTMNMPTQWFRSDQVVHFS